MIHHVKRHKKKILYGAPVLILVTLLGNNIVFDELGLGTTSIGIEPSEGVFEADDFFLASIVINAGEAVNAIEGAIGFSNEFLEVAEISTGSSIIDLWVFEPTLSTTSERGIVTFTGGSTRPGGFLGSGEIFNVLFRTKKPGKVEVSFSDARILAHNGIGSDVLQDEIDAEFLIRALWLAGGGTDILTKDIAEITITTDEPPSPDINGDGSVTLKDVSLFIGELASGYTPLHDFNQDGAVNLKDTSILLTKLIRA